MILLLSLLSCITLSFFGYTINQNFKIFKEFIQTPTLFLLKNLGGTHYFKNLLIEKYRENLLRRWGETFRNRRFTNLLQKDIQSFVRYSAPLAPWIEEPAPPITDKDRQEMALRFDFLRNHEVLIERDPSDKTKLIDKYALWKKEQGL